MATAVASVQTHTIRSLCVYIYIFVYIYIKNHQYSTGRKEPRHSPSALCVGAWRSLCRAAALSRCSLCQAPAPSRSLCRVCGARRSLCRLPALSASGPQALCVGPGALCRAPALSSSLCVGPGTLCWPGPSSEPRATHPLPRAYPSSDPRATHPAQRVPFFQERTPKLTVWG